MKQNITSIEIRTLLNPAFCGHIIRHCIHKYQKIALNPLPYPLVFFILPMILHKETRDEIPSVTKKLFHPWLMENPTILIGFSTRIRNLIPITKDALVFLHHCKSIEVQDGMISLLNYKVKSKESDSLEVEDCFKKSETLGKWFAQAGTTTSIYSMLGVQP